MADYVATGKGEVGKGKEALGQSETRVENVFEQRKVPQLLAPTRTRANRRIKTGESTLSPDASISIYTHPIPFGPL
ncbi:hypothetical protein CC1G_13792 [Coprinopsis cinerea okayama7|uniref:Uncharacterized protein n=1 Tax=Coprinopsis cinerea (strain Okayama-7 / 130 / ATCC MYA-4618 / FGSC 9003) TaxID=240176 RepID=D6RKA0_COPC7|nr:hypothetical protein CC1G_13792 [Coprinopsis cinerea okayama7\|eukprot:XP_002912261.1 hypothetical protein CC1G_13792 [Coprinopsis cinerea okayama7\